MRIVTLLPSATEIVASLSAADQIVGISHECDHPPLVTDRPRLTATTLPDDLGTRAIDTRVVHAMVHGEPLYVVDAEKLEALQPDIVVTQATCTVCAVTPTHIGLLPQATEARIIALQACDIAGMLSDVHTVGEAIGRRAEARVLVDSLEEQFGTLTSTNPDGPRVLFAEWTDPLWIGGHWVPELVTRAGGVDVYAKAGEPSFRSTWGDALARDPDIVVFGACGTDLSANRETAATIPTGRARRFALDANRLTSRPGPRLVDGLRVMRAIIAGELSGVDSTWVTALPPVT